MKTTTYYEHTLRKDTDVTVVIAAGASKSCPVKKLKK